MNEIQGKLASEILTQVMYHGLEVEVVLDAMALVKEDPTMDSTRALVLAAADLFLGFIFARRYATYRGDPDGWMIIDVNKRSMTGPISETAPSIQPPPVSSTPACLRKNLLSKSSRRYGPFTLRWLESQPVAQARSKRRARQRLTLDRTV